MKSSQAAVVDRVISAIEVSGGLYGLYIVALAVYNAGATFGVLDIVVAVISAAYFALSIAGGIQLAHSHGRAVALSKLVQLAQVVHVQALGVRVGVLSGVEITFAWSGWTWDTGGAIGSYLKVAYHTSSDTVVAVNIVALAFAIYLFRVKRQDKIHA